jgi:hypothetical protein
MITADLESAVAALKELVEEARVIAPSTGAGISTECGIPDFRSPGGLWATNRPIGFDNSLPARRCAMNRGAGVSPLRTAVYRGSPDAPIQARWSRWARRAVGKVPKAY